MASTLESDKADVAVYDSLNAATTAMRVAHANW